MATNQPEAQNINALTDSLDDTSVDKALSINPFHNPMRANQARRSMNDKGRAPYYLFPSDEWAVAWVEAFNTNANAGDLLQRLVGRWRFEVERDRTGPGGVWEVLVDADGAHLVDLSDLNDANDDLRGMVRATHERWYKLFCGKADLRMSILTRRVHVTGDLKELRALAKELVAVGFSAKMVPTMYLCDS